MIVLALLVGFATGYAVHNFIFEGENEALMDLVKGLRRKLDGDD